MLCTSLGYPTIKGLTRSMPEVWDPWDAVADYSFVLSNLLASMVVRWDIVFHEFYFYDLDLLTGFCEPPQDFVIMCCSHIQQPFLEGR